MKNYYEILEIDQNASKEVIEKAYKVLVKKYHPDLQETQEAKAKFEEKIKKINEAYNIISNPELRAEYDAKLEEENKIKKQVEAQRKAQEENYRRQEPQPTQNEVNQNNSDEEYKAKIKQIMREREQEKQYNEAINKAYHDAYIQDLKNRGYKIRYKKTLNDYVRSLIALLITIGIIFLILQLPFVKNYINNLYQNNDIIRGIIDAVSNIFK